MIADSMEARILEASHLMETGEEAMERLRAAGRPVADAEQRYRTALTAYRQMALVQHSLDLDALEALTLQVLSSARNIAEAADVAAERRWEHKLLLIPVWFLALAVVILARFRIAERATPAPDAPGPRDAA
jgi:hypothetical protein